MTGSASAGLQLQCIAIATFSSFCITCVLTTFINDDNASRLKTGVIKLLCEKYTYVFYVFVQNPKKHEFYVFELLHVFSNIGHEQCYRGLFAL